MGARTPGPGSSFRDPFRFERVTRSVHRGSRRRPRGARFGRPGLSRRKCLPRGPGPERSRSEHRSRAAAGRRDLLDRLGGRIRETRNRPRAASHADGVASTGRVRPRALDRRRSTILERIHCETEHRGRRSARRGRGSAGSPRRPRSPVDSAASPIELLETDSQAVQCLLQQRHRAAGAPARQRGGAGRLSGGPMEGCTLDARIRVSLRTRRKPHDTASRRALARGLR